MTVDREKLSPMMKHYFKLKDKYPGVIIMYRLGDFYEMFFDDAVVVSKELEITLTGRDCGLPERAPMCGVPYHAVDNYLSRLIAKGYKVAICEQLTAPGDQKGMVERDVVRVVTAGTVIEDTLLDEKKDNYVSAAFIGEQGCGFAWLEMTTGEFNLVEYQGDDFISKLENMINTVVPSEIISNSTNLGGLQNGSRATWPAINRYYDWAFTFDYASKALKKQLNVSTLDSYECSDKRYAICAAGALLEYLNDTQKRSLSHIDKIRYYKTEEYMVLDSTARRNLELTETMRDRKSKGTLLWVLDKTTTNMGARNLRRWIERPLIDSKRINDRLDAVAELCGGLRLRNNLTKALSDIRDLERLNGKVAYGSINPREMNAIGLSLLKLPMIKRALENVKSPLLCQLRDDIDELPHICKLLNSALCDEPPILIRDGGFIRNGFSAELDEYRRAGKDGMSWLADLEAKERETTGIKTLKVGYNKVFGYYIEISKSYLESIPFRYIRKQTLTTGERFITPELKEIEEKILGAGEKSIALEQQIYTDLKNTLLSVVQNISKSSRAIAELDTLLSFALVAIENKYVKPIINGETKKIAIDGGRHPVVEKILGQGFFVSNDTQLNDKDCRTMVITGPNMAGKSTYMRQVALIAIMAHIGSFVPANKAEISIIDRVFTRVGASDDLSLSQSTFMVEMVEVASILNNATKNSLLVLDEIGRGTSTYDGLSIAWSVMEYVGEVIKAKTLFATHYHELTELEGRLAGVKNYRVLVNEMGDSISFLHKIVRGGANKSFGVEVAKLAGVPSKVTDRAKEIAKMLESRDDKDINGIFANSMTECKKVSQLSLFDNDNSDAKEIVKILKETKIDNCTPVQAMLILADLVERAKNGKN